MKDVSPILLCIGFTVQILSIRHLFRLAAMGDVAAVGQETFRITVSANTSCWMSKAHYVSDVS